MLDWTVDIGRRGLLIVSVSHSVIVGRYTCTVPGKTQISRILMLSQEDVERATPDLRRCLDKLFAKELKHFSAEKRNHYVDGICRVVASSQRTLTLDIVKGGFAETGQYKDGSFSFDQTMSNTTYKLSQDQLQVMRDELDGLSRKFRAQGYITEEQLDEAGIASVNVARSVPKDARPYYRQRAMLLNALANVSRYKQYPLVGRLAPVPRAALKAQLKAEKQKQKDQAKENAQIERDNAYMEREHEQQLKLAELAVRRAKQCQSGKALIRGEAEAGVRVCVDPEAAQGCGWRAVKPPKRFDDSDEKGGPGR